MCLLITHQSDEYLLNNSSAQGYNKVEIKEEQAHSPWTSTVAGETAAKWSEDTLQ